MLCALTRSTTWSGRWAWAVSPARTFAPSFLHSSFQCAIIFRCSLLSVIIIARMLRCPCFGSTYAMQFSSISPRSSFSHAYSSLLLENHQHDEEKLTTKMPDPTPLPTKRRWKEPILDCYLLLHQASLVLGQAGILGLYSCGLNLIACAFRLVLIVFFAN